MVATVTRRFSYVYFLGVFYPRFSNEGDKNGDRGQYAQTLDIVGPICRVGVSKAAASYAAS